MGWALANNAFLTISFLEKEVYSSLLQCEGGLETAVKVIGLVKPRVLLWSEISSG